MNREIEYIMNTEPNIEHKLKICHNCGASLFYDGYVEMIGKRIQCCSECLYPSNRRSYHFMKEYEEKTGSKVYEGYDYLEKPFKPMI